MIVLFHVTVALAGLLSSGWTYISPSKVNLRTSYALVALTLVSGTYLVISTHSPMLQSCLAGLAYIGVCLFGILTARQKIKAHGENSS